MLCVGWGCGGVGVLPLLGGFSCKVFSSVSPRFYFRKHAFCFLPLATILESPVCVLDDSHSNRSEVESQHDFHLPLLYGQVCRAFLCVFVWLFVLLSVHLTISSLIINSFWEFSFWAYWSLVRGKDFLPFCGLPLQSGDHLFCCTEDF
jgi:hypothetical protein